MGAKKPVNLNEGLKAKQTQLDNLRKALLEQVTANEAKVKAELEAVLRKDNAALGDSQPHINYYAPNAGEQLKHKHQILELNIQKLNYLEATFLWVNQQQNALEVFLKTPDTTEDAQKSALASFNSAIKNAEAALKLLSDKSDPEKIVKLPGIDTILQKLTLQTELKNIENELKSINSQIENDDQAFKKDKLKPKERAEIQTKKLELESRKETIQDEVSKFKDETDKLIDYKTIKNEKNFVERKLTKHINLEKKIPNGMMDVKKALYILENRRITERKIDKKRQELSTLNDIEKEASQIEISALEQKVASLQFSTSEEEEKKIIVMLDDLKMLMSIGIKEYRDMATNGGELNALLHKTTAFYWENLYVYREALTSVNNYFTKAQNLTENGQVVKECVSKAFDELPEKDVINSALKKVDAVDIDLKKRQKLYEDKGSKGQTGTNFYKGSGIRFIEGLLKQKSNDEGVESGKQDLFHIPYNSGMYVLDHPADTDLADTLGNCFGEAHMFLQRINGKKPTMNTMCPEADLINFQLDQTRKIAGCKNKINLAHVVKTVNEQAEDKGRIHWNDIKGDILKEATSTKNGDVCVVHFGGATVEGHAGTVGHAIGLIKMKNPDPYKYVLYDYGLGALGFSTDKQLQAYFDLLLNYYVPFYKVNVEKLTELSNEGYQFIKNIKPVEAADLSKKCERDNWSDTRLMLFEKYAIQEPEGILTLLKQAKNLSESQQASLYEKALAHKKLPLNELLTIAVATSNLNFFNRILEDEDFSSIGLKQALSLVIQQQPTDRVLLNRILKDPLLPQKDLTDALGLAFQQKDDRAPELVKAILMTFDDLSKVTHNDLKEALIISDPAFVHELLETKKITVERVAKRCGLASNLAIMKICCNYDVQAIKYAGKKILNDLKQIEPQTDVAAEVVAKSEKDSNSSPSVTPEGVSPLETAPDEKQDEVESLSDDDRTPSISPQHETLQETEIPGEPDNKPAATEKAEIEAAEMARLAVAQAAREESERKAQEEEAAEKEKIATLAAEAEKNAARIAENTLQQTQLQEQESPLRIEAEQKENTEIENILKRAKEEADEIAKLAAETKQINALYVDESIERGPIEQETADDLAALKQAEIEKAATLAAETEAKRENAARIAENALQQTQQNPLSSIEPPPPVMPYTPEQKVIIEQPPIVPQQPTESSVAIANQPQPFTFNFEKVFKIPPTDDLSEVEKAFHKLALLYHPDKDRLGIYTEQWNELQSALEIVNSPEKLTNYYAQSQANLIEAPAEVLQIKNRPEETAVNVDVMKKSDEPMGRLAVSQMEREESERKTREEAALQNKKDELVKNEPGERELIERKQADTLAAMQIQKDNAEKENAAKLAAEAEVKRKNAAVQNPSPPPQTAQDHKSIFTSLKEQLSSMGKNVNHDETKLSYWGKAKALANKAKDEVKAKLSPLSIDRKSAKETMILAKIAWIAATDNDNDIIKNFNSLCKIAGKERNRAWDLFGKNSTLAYSTNTTSAQLLINTLKNNEEFCALLKINGTPKERAKGLENHMKAVFKNSEIEAPDFTPKKPK